MAPPKREVFSLQTSVQVSEVPDDDSEAGIGTAGQAFLEGVSLVRKTSSHFYLVLSGGVTYQL